MQVTQSHLWAYFKASYDESLQLVRYRYISQLFILALLLEAVYLDGYRLYVATCLVFIVSPMVWYFDQMSKKNNSLAHEFHKIYLIIYGYGSIPEDLDISNCKTKVNLKIDSRAKKLLGDNGEEKYPMLSSSNPSQKLLAIMQENAFWNHHLFEYTYKKYRSIIAIIILVFILTILLLLPFISIDSQYTIPRLAFTLLSFNIIYDMADKILKYKQASKEMLEIDNEIARIDANTSCGSLLHLFHKYNQIKQDCPHIPTTIYKSNRERLNEIWSHRADSMNSLGKSGNMKNMIETLEKLSSKISSINEPWAITGGCNLYLKGLTGQTRDIDIITTKKGVEQIAEIVFDNQNHKVNRTTKNNVTSYFIRFKIEKMDIEVMGDPENLVNNEWIVNNIWEKFICHHKIENITIPLASINYEIFINCLLGNSMIANKITQSSSGKCGMYCER